MSTLRNRLSLTDPRRLIAALLVAAVALFPLLTLSAEAQMSAPGSSFALCTPSGDADGSAPAGKAPCCEACTLPAHRSPAAPLSWLAPPAVQPEPFVTASLATARPVALPPVADDRLPPPLRLGRNSTPPRAPPVLPL